MRWWLSYAGEGGCNGVVILRAPDFVTACLRSAQAGLSPGGQVAGTNISDHIRIADEWQNRCLSAGEAAELASSIDERYL